MRIQRPWWVRWMKKIPQNLEPLPLVNDSHVTFSDYWLFPIYIYCWFLCKYSSFGSGSGKMSESSGSGSATRIRTRSFIKIDPDPKISNLCYCCLKRILKILRDFLNAHGIAVNCQKLARIHGVPSRTHRIRICRGRLCSKY